MWAQNNPHWFAETNVQDDPRIMVFGGVWGDSVIGPYFFDGTVTGSSFGDMLENKVSHWSSVHQDVQLSKCNDCLIDVLLL